MSPSRPALLDASAPARCAALLTALGLALLPWTLTLPDTPFGAWWVLTLWLPALTTVVLAPAESLGTLRWCRDCCRGRVDASLDAWGRSRRLHVPRAGAGAVRIRLRRPQGVRKPRRRIA
jgi:hypothetical protein